MSVTHSCELAIATVVMVDFVSGIFSLVTYYFDISDFIYCYHLCNTDRINILYPISHILMYVYIAVFYIRIHFNIKIFDCNTSCNLLLQLLFR